MKFAKELEQDLVPEWRIKYLNYKAGKKYVKAVSRAIGRANGTPSLGRRTELPPRSPPSGFFDIARTFSSNSRSHASHDIEEVDPLRSSPAPLGKAKVHGLQSAPAMAADIPPTGEHAGLTRSPGSDMQYGSFVPTPSNPSPMTERGGFELPAPAMRSPFKPDGPALQPASSKRDTLSRLALQRSASMAPTLPSGAQPAGVTPSSGGSFNPRGRLVRIFSVASPLGRRASKIDIGMQSLDEVREREREFFRFLDRELEKIESFYIEKEKQATRRLEILREQLHEMRNRRTEEISQAKRRKEAEDHGGHQDDADGSNGKEHHRPWTIFRPGPNSKALQHMARTPVMPGQSSDERRDYVRRPHDSDVPYRTAKRKLKLALQEFYRGLELLKSYALLNRTAFRKLNKKYDKAVNARPPYRYMNGKVNKSWFVNSDVLDGHIRTVEDLYARYFERGNHKIAAGKLRNLARRPSDTSGHTFLNGLLISLGGVFAIQGAVHGAELLFDNDPVTSLQASYLLQIYGGYFLCLYIFMLFCLDCRVWTLSKVNYHFIFEFDPRNQLDWRELSAFPSFFLALFGVFLWLNFSQFGNWQTMFLYWPVLLIFITILVLFFPAPVLYHKSRMWLLYSLYRLFFAGFYPVEFRDFFLGDIFCSLTYSMANIELFFCLYAQSWGNPVQCNSNHSRLLGFFTTLPAIWRALQCIRRYHDTRNVFPHLVNCGKYTCTILSYMLLSMYRVEETHTNLALFITFSTINSIYCSIWDIFMDVSLLQAPSKHFLLRDILALKSRWVYYAFMVLDPILRFAWIFYAIFTYDSQHSTIVSFLASFAEVTRRGMWAIFRVENEHCANVAQYKASRDIPLPYHLELFVERPSTDSAIQDTGVASPKEQPQPQPQPPSVSSAAPSARTTGAQMPGPSRAATVETTGTPSAEERTPASEASGTLRRRQRSDTMGRMSIRRVMAEAHKQDFEKKRRRLEEDKGAGVDDDEGSMHSEDDDEDEDSGSLLEDQMEARQLASMIRADQGDNGSPA